ncbi:hypothetical protein [Nocardiopsis synnemataformans]
MSKDIPFFILLGDGDGEPVRLETSENEHYRMLGDLTGRHHRGDTNR